VLINFKNTRLLVIAPHADDEVLGCGGLISKIKNDGGKVFVLIFNVGSIEKYNNKKFTDLRKKEAAAAMKFLKVDKYDTIFDSPNDNRYLDAKPLHELISKIETESKVSLAKIKPTIVAIPSINSHHQDHIHIFKACIAALRPLNKPIADVVISYEAPEHSRWSASGVFQPNLYIDIEKYLARKISAFYKYKSQIRMGGRDKHTIKNHAEYRGKEAGRKVCEAYFVHRLIR
jgi:LmbE family N-acetylglucosaminyl deacetylase